MKPCDCPHTVPRGLRYPAVSGGAGSGLRGEGWFPPRKSPPLFLRGQGWSGHHFLPTMPRASCTWAAPWHPLPGVPQQRLDAEALAAWGLGTGQLVGPAVQHTRARVRGKTPRTPPLPAPAQGRALQSQHLGWEQAHGDHPEAALGLGLRKIFRHLAEASVGGEVAVDGILLALPVIPEEGDVGRT